jgi:excisionase family DNA binding protein
MKNLLTVAQAAEQLNIKVSTVRAWLAKRKLPASKLWPGCAYSGPGCRRIYWKKHDSST